MRPRKYFKIGQKISGNTLDGLKIIGEFRGYANSYGAYVYGVPVNSNSEPKLYRCLRLTLTVPTSPEETKSKSLPSQFKPGDPCTGYTYRQEKISGYFVQYEGKKAWLKGWPEGTSKFDPARAFSVLRETLKPGLS